MRKSGFVNSLVGIFFCVCYFLGGYGGASLFELTYSTFERIKKTTVQVFELRGK